MSTTRKGAAVHMWIQDEDAAKLQELAEHTEVSKTEILSKIVAAGLRCLNESGNRLTLPLRFTLADTVDTPEAKVSSRLRR